MCEYMISILYSIYILLEQYTTNNKNRWRTFMRFNC